MSLRQSFNRLARHILYLWVKTEVLPTPIEQLDFNPENPVIYVLETRSWANLLVLEEQCQALRLPAPLDCISADALKAWHAVYTIAPRQPFKAWLQKDPKRSRMLRGLIEALKENPELEIQFIPVSIFWGRPVATQKHWLKVLFADSWALGGRLRTFFKIIFHGRNTLLHYSEIITYRHDSHSQLSNDILIDQLQKTLSKRLINLRTATLGPDISHQRTLVRNLILNPTVQKAIKKRSIEDHKTEDEATLQARRYLNEIVANCTNITIQVMQRALSWFWNQFYSGIEVQNNEYLKNLALSHELVYVPCHRSHIDYLLLSYVIYFEGLALPYIAAGKNLNIPIIGSILRGGGAFFIRRRFKGNELYSTVMFEYVAELIAQGTPIGYFIEGGRSRTGRLLQPKPGMLAMTVRGFLKYRKRPVAFIPVNIGYEKLLESKAYQAELSGQKKRRENLFDSIKSILRIRGEFGKVYTTFGKPIFLNQLLNQHHPNWSSETYNDEKRPDWLRHTVNHLSRDIMEHINQATHINAINLIACALLATPKQKMDEKALIKRLEMYQSLIGSLNYSKHITLTKRTGKQQIEHAEFLNMVKRRPHELGDIIFLDAKHAISLTYYRNNVLHLMALPSLIACCFFNMRTLPHDKIIHYVSMAYPFIQKELFLNGAEKKTLTSIIDNSLDELVRQGLLSKNEKLNTYSRRAATSPQMTQLTQLARVISPILEVYYLTLTLLSRSRRKNGNKPVIKEAFQKDCFLLAQRVAMIHENNSPDYSDKNLIASFINTLIDVNYLTLHDAEEVEYSHAFQKTDKRIRLLLPKEMRVNILQIIDTY